jgi:hypothetical protein
MVEAVSTVHMRASLSAGGTVSFMPPVNFMPSSMIEIFILP